MTTRCISGKRAWAPSGTEVQRIERLAGTAPTSFASDLQVDGDLAWLQVHGCGTFEPATLQEFVRSLARLPALQVLSMNMEGWDERSAPAMRDEFFAAVADLIVSMPTLARLKLQACRVSVEERGRLRDAAAGRHTPLWLSLGSFGASGKPWKGWADSARKATRASFRVQGWYISRGSHPQARNERGEPFDVNSELLALIEVFASQDREHVFTRRELRNCKHPPLTDAQLGPRIDKLRSWFGREAIRVEWGVGYRSRLSIERGQWPMPRKSAPSGQLVPLPGWTCWNPWLVDLREGKFQHRDESFSQRLPPRPLSFLRALADAGPGNVVTYAQIELAVWPKGRRQDSTMGRRYAVQVLAGRVREMLRWQEPFSVVPDEDGSEGGYCLKSE